MKDNNRRKQLNANKRFRINNLLKQIKNIREEMDTFTLEFTVGTRTLTAIFGEGTAVFSPPAPPNSTDGVAGINPATHAAFIDGSDYYFDIVNTKINNGETKPLNLMVQGDINGEVNVLVDGIPDDVTIKVNGVIENDVFPILLDDTGMTSVLIEVSRNQDVIMGDLNNDGVVNILDILALVQIVIGNKEATSYQLSVGDLNNDGVVNILDILALVQIVIN